MNQLTVRTRELLDILTRYSNKTRYTWIILNVISLILISVVINEKLGGTKPRIAVRFWNSNFHLVESNPIDKTNNNSEKNKSQHRLGEKLVEVDALELNKLISQQLLEFESVKIPLIGVSISSRDATFVGAIGLLIIYLWYLLSIIKERSVLAQLIYPLIAKPTDEKAKNLWGERDNNGSVNEENLSKKIEIYKKEVIHIKEAISSNFLTLYSSSKRRWFEFFTTGILTFMPLVLLVFSLSLDIYWDFGKTFKETNMKFNQEILHYEEKLTLKANEIKRQKDKESIDLSNKLMLASEQLKKYSNTMIFKRATSTLIVIILASICVFDLLVARSMTRILTNMNQCPEKLTLKEYVDA